MNKIDVELLKAHRIELIEEYFYWMTRDDCDEEVLEDIENEIKEVEKTIWNHI